MVAGRLQNLRPLLRLESRLGPGARLIYWLIAFQVLALVYLPVFGAPFFYDDIPSIVENSDLRFPAEPWRLLRDHGTSLQFDRRPVGGLFTLVNFQIAGLNPAGYHAANFVLHWIAAVLIAEFIALAAARLRTGGGRLFGLAVATLWALHPLNSTAVAYVYQRMEQLMAIFALASLYALLRVPPDAGRKRRGWLAAAWCAAVLALLSKEVAVMLPLALALADRLCTFASWRELWRRRRGFYLALLVAWVPILWWMARGVRVSELDVGDPLSTPWGYLKVQAGVVLEYLRLVVWPEPLVFYRTPRFTTSAADWLPQAAVLCGLAACLVLAGRSHRWVWLAAGLFALVLVPTSSVIPVPLEPSAEFRMYLPSACAVAVVLGALEYARRQLLIPLRAAAVVALALCAVLGSATHSRSRVFADRRSIWSDVVSKDPSNARAWINLGAAEVSAGNAAGARSVADVLTALWEQAGVGGEHFAQALRGEAALIDGDFPAAETHLRASLAADPSAAPVRLDLAEALAGQGKLAEALEIVNGVLDRNEFDWRAAALKVRILRAQAGKGKIVPNELSNEAQEPLPHSPHGGLPHPREGSDAGGR
ncbi:tetratricopeptide repeat protein [soil metagenome]